MRGQGFVSLEYLQELLQTSESTIRRDLAELERQGLLKRVHGGAEHLRFLSQEENMQEKAIKHVAEKQAIANCALQQIQDGETIFVDAGTTTAFLLEGLAQKAVRVVTNSIHHSARLVDLHVPTLMIGGQIKETTDACIGAAALEQVQALNFDRAFMGMNGLDQNWYYTPDPEEAALKKAVFQNASKVYVLADPSKYYQTAFVKVARVDAATLVTAQSQSSLMKRLEEKTEVLTA